MGQWDRGGYGLDFHRGVPARQRLQHVIDPKGQVITYTYTLDGVGAHVTYDPLGRLSQLRNALGDFGFTCVGATGRPESMMYPNGQQIVQSYFDNLGDQRLRQLRYVGVDGTVLSQFDYTYEVTGEIVTQGRYQPDLEPAQSTYAYRYDAASQLLAAELEDAFGALRATYDYVYDVAGNRTVETVSADARFAAFNPVNQLISLQHGGVTQAIHLRCQRQSAARRRADVRMGRPRPIGGHQHRQPPQRVPL